MIATDIESVIFMLERDEVEPSELRAVLAACVRAYSRIQEQTGDHVVPYDSGSGVTPTDALRTAAGLLRESDVSSFEMAMMLNL